MFAIMSIHTLGDERSDRLVGLAMFESRKAAERILPLAHEAIVGDDFDTWEAVPASTPCRSSRPERRGRY